MVTVFGHDAPFGGAASAGSAGASDIVHGGVSKACAPSIHAHPLGVIHLQGLLAQAPLHPQHELNHGSKGIE